MTWEIHTLDLGEVEVSQARMLAGGELGALMRAPVQGWLLTRSFEGQRQAVVIDTGFRFPDILTRLGDRARGIASEEQKIVPQLARFGLTPQDVDYVFHTHLHIDHAGQTDVFPMSTTVVVNRRELEYAVSGLSGPSYPPEDIKHIIDRLHTPESLCLLDLELTHEEEVMSGIRCMPAGGHTEGSMLIYVDSTDGLACFCGDLVYSVKYQLQSPTVLRHDPKISANHVVSRRSEKAALKRLLKSAPKFMLYPSHDAPVPIEKGKVAGEVKAEGCGPSGCWCGAPATA